jgi:S-adenosylmethionine decarboxylase
MAMIVGKHIIAELYGVPKELISYEKTVRDIVEEVVDAAGLTKVGSVYKQFNPHGVTGIVLIAESHVSIHTWPEYEMVNLDIFTCGDIKKTERAFELFLERFKPKEYRHYVLDRG